MRRAGRAGRLQGRGRRVPGYISLRRWGRHAHLHFRAPASSPWGLLLTPSLCLSSLCRSGVEFVLKTFDGQWLSWEQGHHSSNFYMQLPLRP